MRFYVLIILLLCSCGEKSTKSDSQSPEKDTTLPKGPATTHDLSQKTSDEGKKTKVPLKKADVPEKPVDPSLLKPLDALDKKEFFKNVVGISTDELEKKYKTYLDSLTDEQRKKHYDDLSMLDNLSTIKVLDRVNHGPAMPLNLEKLFEIVGNLGLNNANESKFGFPTEDKDASTFWFIAKEMKEKLEAPDPGIKGLVKETIKTSSIDAKTQARILYSIRVQPIKPKDVLTEYEAWFDDKPWFKHSSTTYKFIKKSLENFDQDVKNDIQTIAQHISDSITKATPPGFDPLVKDELVKLGFLAPKGFGTHVEENKYTIKVYAEALDTLFKGKTRGISKDMLNNKAIARKLYSTIDQYVAKDLFKQMTTDLKASNLEEKVIKPLATILVEVNAKTPVLGERLFNKFFDIQTQKNNHELISMYYIGHNRVGYLVALKALLKGVEINDSVLYNMSPDLIIETGRSIK